MFNPPNPLTFFPLVWDIVEQIPAGKVSSYGQIASMIPPDADLAPTRMKNLAPRWVGTAMRRSPRDKDIPWHRVINSQGSISFPPGSPQADEQRRRLELEGVCFDERGKVDFALVGWSGPHEAFLRRKGLLAPRSLK
ncbi:MAG: MGMT family protein [Chloroflexi bacterium]|nr:MGMT family protein [Chloroflexota bacterium]